MRTSTNINKQAPSIMCPVTYPVACCTDTPPPADHRPFGLARCCKRNAEVPVALGEKVRSHSLLHTCHTRAAAGQILARPVAGRAGRAVVVVRVCVCVTMTRELKFHNTGSWNKHGMSTRHTLPDKRVSITGNAIKTTHVYTQMFF